MNRDERIVCDTLSVLCLEWQFPQEMDVLMAILEQHLPGVRKGPGWSPMVEAAQSLLLARSPVEISDRKATAGRALAVVLRSQLAANIRGAA